MKRKVREKLIEGTTHRTQQYTTNHHHLGQCDICYNEEPNNFSNLFRVCVSSAKAPRHCGELKENWMKMSLKHKMMHNLKRFPPGLHFLLHHDRMTSWQKIVLTFLECITTSINNGNDHSTIFDHYSLRKGPFEVIQTN